ncbi:MAG: GNAT family N-acetyltransferase [Rhodococcus sp.]|nr:GNAT family N-acetyltransferase [Rhodococcus sp. (in: high G+C Gram-positive bacteria)]
MTTLQRTTPDDPRFVALCADLDADLRERYGAAQDAYDQFNGMDDTAAVVIAVVDGDAVGCGAFKHYSPTQIEIKRVFVTSAARGRRIGGQILSELEKWAIEEGYGGAVLETGTEQPESLALYTRAGFQKIDNYPPYVDMPLSVCLSKSFDV